MMALSYNPADWYWIVGGDKTQVYSSARARVVEATDKTFAVWLAAGGVPTRILNRQELSDVLAAANVAKGDELPVPAKSAAMTRESIADRLGAMEARLAVLEARR